MCRPKTQYFQNIYLGHSISLYPDLINIYSELPLYRSSRDLYYLFDITELRYKGCYINVLEVLGENIHFDISEYFVIPEFDIEGVDCSSSSILSKFQSILIA